MSTVKFVGFTRINGVLTAVEMTGRMTESGHLEHFINGELRAVVPAEGQLDYITEWPDLAPLVVGQ